MEGAEMAPGSGAAQQGYDEGLFLHEVEEDFKCPLCLNVLRDPVQVCTKGHTFCRGCAACVKVCVSAIPGLQSCPYCMGELIENPVDNLYIRNKIESLPVRCPHTVRQPGGCAWSGRLADAQAHHQRECPLHPVRCRGAGCGFEAARAAVQEHELACPLASPRCPECGGVSAAEGARCAPCEEDVARIRELRGIIRELGEEAEAREARIRERREDAETLRVGGVEELSVSVGLVRQGVYRTVDFGESWLSGAEVRRAAELLEGCAHTQQIRLMHTGVEAGEIGALARALRSMPGLKALRFASATVCSSSAEDAALLVGALDCATSLRELDLSGNFLGCGAAASLGGTLEAMTELRRLHLGRNNIGPEGAASLSRSLKGLTLLEVLGLGFNELGDAGATALAGALRHLLRLRKLDLERNDLASKGAAALAGAFEFVPDLRELLLDSNGLRAEGATAVSLSLKHLQALEGLTVGGNGIGDGGATALAVALRSQTNLERLELPCNGIGASSRASVHETLDSNKGLKVVFSLSS